MSGIKIRLPQKLSEKLTPVQFKIWKSQLITYLQQSTDYQRFMHGSKYETWTAAEEDGNRIANLHAEDPAPNVADNPARLATRRTQLGTFLSIIAGVADDSQYDDIMMRSTSLAWIWNTIETDYDIQKKGRHFLKLDSIVYKNDGTQSPMAFYKRLRAHFTDNLRKRGELVKSKNDQPLDQDEKMSPTLENTVVYMALKAIDQRLPSYVEQMYGHRMDENTTLFDMQAEIFQAIPKLIQELDSKDPSLNRVDLDQAAYNYHQDEPTIAAAGQNFPRFPYRPRQPGVYSFRPRPPTRPYTPRFGTARPPTVNNATFRPRLQGAGYVQKFCSLCRDASLPPRVFNSHNLSECQRLNRSTVAQMRSLVLDENVKPEEYPEQYENDVDMSTYNQYYEDTTQYYNEAGELSFPDNTQ